MYPYKEAAFLTLSLISHQLQEKVKRGTSMIATVLHIDPIPSLPFEEQWEHLHTYMAAYLEQFKMQFPPAPPTPPRPTAVMADGGKRKPKRRTLKKSRSYRALVTKINKLKHARTRIRNRR
jgi:hypothetical protein